MIKKFKKVNKEMSVKKKEWKQSRSKRRETDKLSVRKKKDKKNKRAEN